MNKKKISIIIHSFNEEENIYEIYNQLKNIFDTQLANYLYEIIFINDGSYDKTILNIKELCLNDKNVFYINFSRNFGHQYALKAGLDNAYGDAVISLDCDMQHPIKLIPKLIMEWENGFDIVYTIRKKTYNISFLKKISSKLFYKILNKLSDYKIEEGTADFRLLDKKVIEYISETKEYDLFLRGFIQWLGFNQKSIEYTASTRNFGHSKYNLKKMAILAMNGLISSSIKPLIFSNYLGLFFSFLSLLYLPYAIISFFNGNTIPGWISIIVTISFFGGLNLFVLGIVGIYIGKLYLQTKNRPLYIIKDTNLNEKRKIR